MLGVGLLALPLLWWLWRKSRLGEIVSSFATLPVERVEAGGWEFRLHRSGRGPDLILLHGIGADLYCWRWLIPLLNQNYRVLALDLPGFGQSSKPASVKYGLDEQVERLKSLLIELKINHFYLVGNSMGGNIALWYALKYPHQVLGSVVIAPAVATPAFLRASSQWLSLVSWPLSHFVHRRALRWAHLHTVRDKSRVDQERVEATWQTYHRNPGALRAFFAATESLTDPRLGQRLNEIKCRVLILWGTHDNLVPHVKRNSLEAALSLHESHLHEGGGHHLQEDEPAWVAQKIDSFIRQ